MFYFRINFDYCLMCTDVVYKVLFGDNDMRNGEKYRLKDAL